MQVAVWDTYVKKRDGSVLHFDIIVPSAEKDPARIFQFGKIYLASKNEPDGRLETEECQFCHIEEPSQEVLEAIGEQGFYILEMEDIPAHLPAQPSRRDMVLHLRAHYPEHRFADFRGQTLEAVSTLLKGGAV